MKGKKRLLLLLIPAVAVAAALVYKLALSGGDGDANWIRIWGNIEVTDAEVSFKIPGQVLRRLVDEGDMVTQGKTVAILESQDLAQDVALRGAEVWAAQAALAELEAGSRPQEIAQAAAAAAQAQARLDELLAGSRPEEIAAAQATAHRAEVDAGYLKTDHERTQRLFESKIATAHERDLALAAWEMAKARLREAEEQLKLVKAGPRKEEIRQAREALAQTKERYALVKAGPRVEQIEQARARLRQAQANADLAQTRLGYATLVAPLTGVVLSKNVEPGEYVAPGTPVVTVGDLVNVWLRGYINETDLGRVKPGQKVRVTTDTYPGKVYEGRVSFIAPQAEFTPKNVQTAKQRVTLVYRIKVDIRNPDMELKAGMPADAKVWVGKGAPPR